MIRRGGVCAEVELTHKRVHNKVMPVALKIDLGNYIPFYLKKKKKKKKIVGISDFFWNVIYLL